MPLLSEDAIMVGIDNSNDDDKDTQHNNDNPTRAVDELQDGRPRATRGDSFADDPSVYDWPPHFFVARRGTATDERRKQKRPLGLWS